MFVIVMTRDLSTKMRYLFQHTSLLEEWKHQVDKPYM